MVQNKSVNKLRHRILLIGSSTGMGLTFYFARLALKLKERGNEVVVLSDRTQQYQSLSKELARAGIKHYTSDAIDYSDPLRISKGTKDLIAVLNQEEVFEIIHQNGVKHIIKSYMATKGLNCKPKTFATVTSLPESKKAKAVAAVCYKMLVNQSVALCDYTRRTMEKWGVDHNKIVTIPLFAPDLQWFDSAKTKDVSVERYGIQQSKSGRHAPIIFYAASHFSFKGFSYYLQAAKKVLETFDCLFIVGGQGPVTESLKILVKKLGIQRHVLFTGWISQYDMPYVLNNIVDICVSASMREQFPSYVLECMAARKPVIATNVGGVPEAVEDGVNGYLVPPGESEVLSSSLIKMIGDSAHAKKMGEEGRRIVEKRFNIENIMDKLDNAYELALQAK